MNKGILNFQKIIIFVFINIISLNFIITGDDYYFLNTGFDSLLESVFLNSNNGRYLGNFFGVFFSNLYKFQNLQYIRCIVMGTGIFIIILLCNKVANFYTKESFIFTSILILIAPSSIYREVYSWTPGYMNYLMPMILILAIFCIFKNSIISNKDINLIDTILIIILGITCQLFMEHITIYMILFSLFMLLLSTKKYQNIKKLTIPLFISNIIGATIMFSCKGYRTINSGDQYRNIATNSIGDLLQRVVSNLFEMCKDIVIDNTFLSILILIICILIITRNKSYNKKKFNLNQVFICLSLISIIYIFIMCFIDILEFPRVIRLTKYALDVLFTLIFCIILFYVIYKENFECKNQIYFLYSSIIVASLPLIIISPIGPRCFFICYVFLVIICLNMISHIYDTNLIKTPNIKYISIIILSLIVINKVYIYYNVNSIYKERNVYIQQEMEKGSDLIVIPKLPFNKYIQNDLPEFIGQYYYYKNIEDILFKMIDYNNWKHMII